MVTPGLFFLNAPSIFKIKYLAVDLRPIVFKMAVFGLIYYEPETDLVTIKPRMFDYIKNLKHEKDYDILKNLLKYIILSLLI